MPSELPSPRALVCELFATAVAAAHPDNILTNALPPPPKGKTIVIGAGKGAAQLASRLEKIWHHPISGTVVTRYGYACRCEHIRVLEASHPLPDAAGMLATSAIHAELEAATADDLVIALICGGGSALLPDPPSGFTLEDEIALNRQLLASGAPIGAMNAIRSYFSNSKAGRLAIAAYPAPVISLVVSDIPGDDPSLIASGPTIATDCTREDALEAIHNYAIAIPQHIYQHIKYSEDIPPSKRDSRLAKNQITLLASAALSLEAAAKKAEHYGVSTVILSDSIEGESREIAKMHAALAKEIKYRNRPFQPPVILLSGGETTVTVKADGKGGRNSEFALALAIELAGVDGITALAADTDGIDGSEDNAGAIATGQSVIALKAAGYDPARFLANNDAYSAFTILHDAFYSGATGTNVNDFRAIYIHG